MHENDATAKSTDIAAGAPTPAPKKAPAFCPRCRGEMGSADATCPHCGYDFPLRGPKRASGLAFSVVADIALLLGAGIAGLGCAVALFVAFITLQGGHFRETLTALASAILFFALLVVFIRVQQIGPP